MCIRDRDICPVSTADICPVSREDIYPVSTEDGTAAGLRPAVSAAEDICPVSTEDIYPVSMLYICLVLTAGICPVSAADICPVSAADICPVPTADICPVSTEAFWLLWGHLGRDQNDFDPFFTPKMGKMEHARHCRYCRRSHGNDATSRAAEPRSTRSGGQDRVSSLTNSIKLQQACGLRSSWADLMKRF